MNERGINTMSSTQNYAMNMAKEIVIAKLSTSAPSQTNAGVGKNIADMYESIYKKIYEIASSNNTTE